MKPAPFGYHRPTSAVEAAELLASLGEEAKLLAGGQSLLPIMNMRLAEPSDLIDLTSIRALRRAEPADSNGSAAAMSYGATVTHMMIEDGLVPDVTGGLLQRAASGIGYRAVRNRGTLGGSLAHADSSAEWPLVLSALGAEAVVRSARGQRTIPVRELLLGFFSTALEPDEFIEAVVIRPQPDGVLQALHKTNKKVGEFADSLAVALVRRGEGEEIAGAELWLGAARDVPVRLTATEAVVLGRRADAMTPADLIDQVAEDIGGVADELAARHELQLHAVTVLRALRSVQPREESVDDG